MQAIRATNTKMEVVLAKSLWAHGLRYRKNDKTVFGKPDLTFKQYKVAVFVDGEYFHGWNWNINKHRIKTNRAFWWNKITANKRRDRKVNQTLRKQGWTVLRFWSNDIRIKKEACVSEVKKVVSTRK